MRRCSGFSILELLVVLTILGLLFSVVPSFFSKGVSGAEFKGAARNLSASLRSARASAISTSKDITVVFDVTAKSYRISGDQKQYVFPKAITIAVRTDSLNNNAQEQPPEIRFYADGGSTGGRITLTKGEDSEYAIAVDWLTGQVKILE